MNVRGQKDSLFTRLSTSSIKLGVKGYFRCIYLEKKNGIFKNELYLRTWKDDQCDKADGERDREMDGKWL